MIRKLLIGMLLLTSLSSYSQNEMQEINHIKSNINFLYATGTSSVSAEDAANNAKDLIALEIEQWLKENSAEDIAGYVTKSKENLSQIKTQRGHLYRVLVFVKKADVLPYYKEEDVMVVDFVKTKAVPSDNTISVSVVDTPVVALSATAAPIGLNSSQEKEISLKYVLSEREKVLLSLQTFEELNDYINKGRISREIINVGSYKNLPSAGLFYIFIHNKEGKLPACMKKENDMIRNLATNENDAITNYKGCGAIWIQLKQE